MIYVLGGKFNAAVETAKNLKEIGINDFYVCPSKGEEKIRDMMSLEEYAARENLTILKDLSPLYGKKIFFFSVEFDQIIKRHHFHKKSVFINVHFSLLPKYRGTMTSFWPILLREKETGVSIHYIDDGIDTGNIIVQKKFEIDEDFTCRDLYFQYHRMAAFLIKKHLEKIITNTENEGVKQESEKATTFPRFLYNYIPKEFRAKDLRLMEKVDVYNLIRGLIFEEFQLPIVDGKKIKKISKYDFDSRNLVLETNGGHLYAEYKREN